MLIRAALSRLLCSSALFVSQAACAQYCVPSRVVDGDAFHFQRGTELVKVRVAGFDAPERGQPFSRVATAKLQELTQAGAECHLAQRGAHEEGCKIEHFASGWNPQDRPHEMETRASGLVPSFCFGAGEVRKQL